MQEIDITGTTPAAPAKVFRLLGDSTTWPDWTPLDRAEIVRPGGADGTGELREFVNGRFTVREEIVERVPDRRLTYALLDGLPLRDYRAEIDVVPDGTGSRVRWHTTFDAKIPGTGWFWRMAMKKATRQFVDGLVAATARAS